MRSLLYILLIFLTAPAVAQETRESTFNRLSEQLQALSRIVSQTSPPLGGDRHISGPRQFDFSKIKGDEVQATAQTVVYTDPDLSDPAGLTVEAGAVFKAEDVKDNAVFLTTTPVEIWGGFLSPICPR